MNFLHFLGFGKVLTLLLQNQNTCAKEIFNHNSHHPHLSVKEKFWKFVKYCTFEDIAFLPGQCKGKNWNFYIFWILENVVTLLLQNKNACALEIFHHNRQPSSSFSRKNSFWKFVKYFEYTAFLPGQCKGKNWNF